MVVTTQEQRVLSGGVIELRHESLHHGVEPHSIHRKNNAYCPAPLIELRHESLHHGVGTTIATRGGVGTTITTRGGRRPQHANSAQSVTAAVFELRHVDHHGIKTQLVTVVAGRPRVATRGGRTSQGTTTGLSQRWRHEEAAAHGLSQRWRHEDAAHHSTLTLHNR